MSLSHRRCGSAGRPTLVLTHSLVWDSEMFDELVALLADSFDILLIDLPGHGGSAALAAPGLTLEQMADDCAALLTALALPAVHWAGLSMGGMVGLRLALRHPERVRSLILLDTSAQPELPERVAQYMSLATALRMGMGAQLGDAVLPFFFCAKTYAERPELIARYRHKLANLPSVDGLYHAARAVFERGDLSAELPALRLPTLVIVGTEDISTPPERSAYLADHIAGARRVLIPDAGHMSATEQPRAVATSIREFLVPLSSFPA